MNQWVKGGLIASVVIGAFFGMASRAAQGTPWQYQVVVMTQPGPHSPEDWAGITGAVPAGQELAPLAGVPDVFVITTGSAADQSALIEALHALPIVHHAQPNRTYRSSAFTPNDPLYSRQWNFEAVGAPAAWDLDTTEPVHGGDPSVVVAVLDSGFRAGSDYASIRLAAGHDYVNDDSDPTDDNGHGTHVTGTIAESTDNGLGVAGLAFESTIMPVKVLDASGTGSTTGITQGIHFARQAGADIINLSLGGPDDDPILHAAITAAKNSGVVLVAATGNDSANALSYPARYDEVISVSAVRYDQTRPSYANIGTGLDLVAPGGDGSVDQNSDGLVDGILQQTCSGTGCSTFNNFLYVGTSQASPHVAATAALMLAAGAEPSQVQTILESTAKDLGSAGYDTTYGYGLVQTASAVDQAIHDTLGPTGSIRINDGASATTSSTVTLTLDGHDASGVGSMQLSNDGVTYTAPEVFVASKSWNLADSAVGGTATEGPHTVYVKLYDSLSNVSAVLSASIVLDATAPTTPEIFGFQTTARLRPLASGEATVVTRPSFRFSADDTWGLAGFRVAWSTKATAIPSAASLQGGTTFTPPSLTTIGTRYLRVQAQDQAGNLSTIRTFVFRRRAGSIATAATAQQVQLVDAVRGSTVRTFGVPVFNSHTVSFAHADLDRNGQDELVLASRSTGSTVTVLSTTGRRLRQFRVYSPGFTGGLSVAVGDVDGDRSPEIVTVPAKGAAQVTVFSHVGKKQKQFFALPSSFRGGASISVNDVTGDGRAEIVVGTLSRTSRVLIFSGTGEQLGNLTPFGSTSRTGLTLTTVDTDANGVAEIATAERRAGCKLKIITNTGVPLRVVTPFSGAVTQCQPIATDLDSNGRDEVTLIPPTGQPRLIDRTTSTKWRVRSSNLSLQAMATFFLR